MTAVVAVVLGMAGGLILWIAIRSAGMKRRILLAATAVSLASLLHDRLHLVGDAQLWLDWAEQVRLRMPMYNEILPTRLFGVFGLLFADRGFIQAAMEWTSVAAGTACAFLLARVFRTGGSADDERAALVAAFLLVFLQPMSFVFFGHIETYPIFAAALCLFLVRLRTDLDRTGPGVGTWAVAVLLLLVHTLAVLLWPALAAVHARSRGASPRRTFLVYALLTAAAVAVVAAVPSLRAFTVLENRWALHLSAGYLTGVAESWMFVLVIPVVFRLVVGGSRIADDLDLFLLMALPGTLLLPFAVTFSLGFYSDLTLFTPAFILSTAWVGRRAVRAFRKSPARIAALVAPGLLGLAAIVTQTVVDSGHDFFESRLRGRDVSRDGRVYGAQVLADRLRQEGRTEIGLRKIQDALEAVPGSLTLIGSRGEFQAALGDTIAAIESYRQAVDGGRRHYLGPLVSLLNRQRLYAESTARLGSDLETTLVDPGLSASLAVAWMGRNDPEAALQVCDAHLARVPADDAGWYNRAIVLQRLGRTAEAVASLRRAAAIDPSNEAYVSALQILAGS